MAKLTIYSKKTCITCQKALAFLKDHNITYTEKDIVSEPPPKALLEAALQESDLKACLNSRSTIYKEHNLSKASLSKSQLVALMLEDPNLIKRPFIVKTPKNTIYQGFEETTLKDFALTP